MITVILIFFICSLIFYFLDKFTFKIKDRTLIIQTSWRLFLSILFCLVMFYITNSTLFFKMKSNLNNFIILFASDSIFQLSYTLFKQRKIIREKFRKDGTLKGCYFFFVSILGILVLELTLFNYKHYLTLGNNEIVRNDYSVSNMSLVDGKYIRDGEENPGIRLNISEIDVNSFYFYVTGNDSKTIEYEVYARDIESGMDIELGTTECFSESMTSHFKTLNNTYNTSSLYLEIITDDEELEIKDIIINPVIPVCFSIIRVSVLMFFVLAWYIFRPCSDIYQIKLFAKNGYSSGIICGFYCFGIIFFTLLTISNPLFIGNNYYNLTNDISVSIGISVNEYQELAESLVKGQVYLDEDPSPLLKMMENPYNRLARDMLFATSFDKYIWDAAYFNEKYYVYFGIIPVILTYLPVYFLTGLHINNNIVILLGVMGILFGIAFLIKEIIARYFRSTSLGTYLLLLCFIFFTNHFVILYAAKRPDLYSIPIVWGIMFSVWGMYFWIKSKKDDGIIKKKYLLFGSICMALVAGCRPQLLLFSLISLIIFKEEIFSKSFWKQKRFKEIFCFIVPYIVIGLGIMYYNYVRFGSIFDFGSNYNLTVGDMTKRGFSLERFGLGFYYYLLACPNISNVFPFINTLDLSTKYLGFTSYENTFGGIFMLCPILFLGLFFFKFKKYFKEKKLYSIVQFMIIIALIIVGLDIQMGGILPRYFLDFGWLLSLGTAIILLNIIDFLKDKSLYKFFYKAFIISIGLLVVFNFFLLFQDTFYTYKEMSPYLFYKFYYAIQFWL